MEELYENLSIIMDNFWTLRYEEQLLIIDVYDKYVVSKYSSDGKEGTVDKYSKNLKTILRFKSEYSKLNCVGRKFVRINMNNKFSSEGYRKALDGEKYGCYPKYVLEKFNNKHRSIDLTPEIVNYYLLVFISLPSDLQYNLVCRFSSVLHDIDVTLKDYGYPVKMQDDFNDEIYDILRDNYVEYEKMTPDKRMEFIKYLIENQIPRALKYMSETNIRRKIIKMGRNEENAKKLSLYK